LLPPTEIRAVAKLPPTSRSRAAATAAPPPSYIALSHFRHRLAAAKLPPTSRFCAAAIAAAAALLLDWLA